MKPMSGYRVLEIGHYAMVPSAGAALADWGADVIKVERPGRGDPVRGITPTESADGKHASNLSLHTLNRNKRSIAIDLSHPEGLELVLRLAAESDVLMTNYLPHVRRKLGIDVRDVRMRNPGLVYARASGFGPRGEEAETGGYDLLCFWAGSGAQASVTPPDEVYPIAQPSSGYGDRIAGLVLAGGIAAALAHRERTGEGITVDTSLLGTGTWAMQTSLAGAHFSGAENIPVPRRVQFGNPLLCTYQTADRRIVSLCMLEPDRQWPDFCRAVGKAEWLDDPRMTNASVRAVHVDYCQAAIEKLIGSLTVAECVTALSQQKGPWSVVRTAQEVALDPQVAINGYLQAADCDDASVLLAASPVQFDEEIPKMTAAPRLGEHTASILDEIGISPDETDRLLESGVVCSDA